MTQQPDPILDLFTRLSLLLCIHSPEKVRVVRSKDSSIHITAHPANMGHFIGQRGTRIRAIKLLGKRMGLSTNVELARVGDERAYTDARLLNPNSPQVLLLRFIEEMVGAPPITEMEQGQDGDVLTIRIPSQYHSAELAAALDEVFYPVSFGTGEFSQFRLLAQ